MKRLIQIEELIFFLASLYALYLLKVEWWWYLLLLIGPDIGMIGYVIGNKTGAITYNLFHHKAVSLLLLGVGLYLTDPLIITIGVILFGHSCMDRALGYGLKYFKGFQYTHLGMIGPLKEENKNI